MVVAEETGRLSLIDRRTPVRGMKSGNLRQKKGPEGKEKTVGLFSMKGAISSPAPADESTAPTAFVVPHLPSLPKRTE